MTSNDFILEMKKKYNTKVAYTARLDPMARGIIPILIGDNCKYINTMTNTNKIYHVRIICGIKTDSDDPLGIICNLQTDIDIDKFINIYRHIFELNNSTIHQKYHYFSTKALKLRKQGKNIDSYHIVKLYKSTILNYGTIDYNIWKENIISTIDNVDITKRNLNRFRQDDIIKQWNNISLNVLPYIDLELNVSSGFFVRQFISDMNMNLMCYDINRINVYKCDSIIL
jgi:tRNA U55 pseudouridine synthase TruB